MPQHTPPMHPPSPFEIFLPPAYAALKAENPHDGRRMRKLKVSQAFWKLSPEARHELSSDGFSAPQHEHLVAALRGIDREGDVFDTGSGLGIIVRTDYSSEEAWNAFDFALRKAEKDAIATEHSIQETQDHDADMDETRDSPENDTESADGSSESSQMATDDSQLFHIVDAPPDKRDALSKISNISALRLFNDVGVAKAPAAPHGTERVKPNRLIDQDGLQEVYSGKLIWIYDEQSNRDQSVRLVNQRGDIYGTATGDSWRARVSFLPELQLNLFTGTMKIDFGGLDRWDLEERQRNLAEAALLPPSQH